MSDKAMTFEEWDATQVKAGHEAAETIISNALSIPEGAIVAELQIITGFRLARQSGWNARDPEVTELRAQLAAAGRLADVVTEVCNDQSYWPPSIHEALASYEALRGKP